MDSGLREDEQRVMDALVLAWNEWCDIDDALKPEEIEEFKRAIHQAQMILMNRIVRRAYPEYYR